MDINNESFSKLKYTEVIFGKVSNKKLNNVMSKANKYMKSIVNYYEDEYDNTFTTQIIRTNKKHYTKVGKERNYIKSNKQIIDYHPINQQRIKKLERNDARLRYKRSSAYSTRPSTALSNSHNARKSVTDWMQSMFEKDYIQKQYLHTQSPQML